MNLFKTLAMVGLVGFLRKIPFRFVVPVIYLIAVIFSISIIDDREAFSSLIAITLTIPWSMIIGYVSVFICSSFFHFDAFQYNNYEKVIAIFIFSAALNAVGLYFIFRSFDRWLERHLPFPTPQ